MISPDTFRNALVLTGPTASGKSSLAIELASRIGGEIVSMDSMALYRGMDIGTAKPTRDERRQIPHHLIDELDPWQSASVAWWLERAADAVREIEGRGKIAVIVGGTPLYLKAMLSGLFDGPPADDGIRNRLSREAEELGRDHLHKRLAAVDADTAARLHRNDVRRIIRALEVWELTGRPMSDWQQEWKLPVEKGPECLWLELPRADLYHKINRRVEAMFAGGLMEEVTNLLSLPRSLSKEAAQALGYKEVIHHLRGGMGLVETVAEVQKRTRNFAKRQITWFRGLPGCQPATPELTRRLWGFRMKEADLLT
jgi:tRNA dimethylallyltransferase